MDKVWDLTIEYLAKVNNWIPLVAVLFAGLGLIGVVLILAITGCALRKRLVPNWLIWTYFTFATIIIFAHTGNNLAAVVEAMEVPVLVVLVCYILRTLFYRRPRYTYVREEVYARELAKGRVVKNETAVAAGNQNSAREIEVLHQDEKIIATEKDEEKVADVKEEIVLPENKIETKADEAENDLAAAFATVKTETEKEEVKAAEPAAELVDKNDFFTARSTATTTPAQTVTTPTIDLPVVEPIPDKSYQPVREPLISTTPISERIPDLKMASAFNRTTTTTRPVSTTTTSTTRPTTTFNRPATTSTATASSNAFSSMYGPRVVKTTTTTETTNTNTNTNTINAVSASHTVNGNTTSATAIKATSTGTTPHSTQDIMAAIERLRASMKK